MVKDLLDTSTLITGRGVVKFAKEILEKSSDTEVEDMDPEIMSEMQATWGKGTTVVNVLTGRRVTI